MTPIKAVIAAAAAAAFGLAGLVTAPTAAAGDGCIEQPWMYELRMTTRIICDSARYPDGSWDRRRGFFADSFIKTTCSRYSCITRTVPELNVVEEYRVTPDTVLPDEPDWIP
jgi:hypothetical protein